MAAVAFYMIVMAAAFVGTLVMITRMYAPLDAEAEETIEAMENRETKSGDAEMEAELDEKITEIVTAVADVPEEMQSERIYYDIALDNFTQDVIRDICTYYGIDMKLVLAIAQKESGFAQDAVGDGGDSIGMYQIQPWYCERIYEDEGELDLFDIYESTVACCRVLDYLYGKCNDTVKVLNAYNTGDFENYNGYSNDVLRIREEMHERTD